MNAPRAVVLIYSGLEEETKKEWWWSFEVKCDTVGGARVSHLVSMSIAYHPCPNALSHC